MDICIDFDGTCVTHEFPQVGRDIGAAPVLKEIVDNGHNLILFTMRSNGQDVGNVLDDAVDWFKEKDIPLYGIQQNPTQEEWTKSPKAYGQLYIDDSALGVPLKFNGSKRPYVDWDKVEKILIENNII